MSLAAYLARLGFDVPPPPTVESLRALQRALQRAHLALRVPPGAGSASRARRPDLGARAPGGASDG